MKYYYCMLFAIFASINNGFVKHSHYKRAFSSGYQFFNKLFRKNKILHVMSTTTSSIGTTAALAFDNRNIRSLPIDPIRDNYCRQVPNAIFSIVKPTPVKNPKIISLSTEALTLVGLDGTDNFELLRYLSGNEIMPGSQPYAHCYCGHQFGSFAGQLGDGAAISLGEIINTKGERWEIQLKGAGITPYSRTADGRKVLRSTVREYLCSEAMYYLGVPTTRAGSCITSDTTVQRDPLYDGTVIDERCTIVSRIAPNFFRFGSFEIARVSRGEGERGGPSAGNINLLKALADHIITSYYPDLKSTDSVLSDTRTTTSTDTGAGSRLISQYGALLLEVTRRTAKLIAKWQCIGFVHGVLNTDNFSIMGITIDYGPFGFMESYDPEFVPNGSDNAGRYSYQQQPEAGQWALNQLRISLLPLLTDDENQYLEEEMLRMFQEIYQQEYLETMRRKLGLTVVDPEDELLVKDLFACMSVTRADFTDTFQVLTSYVEEWTSTSAEAEAEAEGRWGDSEMRRKTVDRLLRCCPTPTTIAAEMKRQLRIYRPSMPPQQTMQLWSILQTGNEAQISDMFGDHPIEILKAEIQKEKRKLDKMLALSKDMTTFQNMTVDYKSASDTEAWSSWLQRYTIRLQREDTTPSSSSSSSGNDSNEPLITVGKRVAEMRAVNPSFVLRNWVAQEAIKDAEGGDFAAVNTLLEMLSRSLDPALSTVNRDTTSSSTSSSSSSSATPASCSLESPEGSKETESTPAAVTPHMKRFLGKSPDWAASLICTCSS